MKEIIKAIEDYKDFQKEESAASQDIEDRLKYLIRADAAADILIIVLTIAVKQKEL